MLALRLPSNCLSISGKHRLSDSKAKHQPAGSGSLQKPGVPFMLERWHFTLRCLQAQEWRRPGGMNWGSQAPPRAAMHLRSGQVPCGNIGVQGYLQHSWEKPCVLTPILTPGSKEEVCCHCLSFIGTLSSIPLKPTLWDNHRKSARGFYLPVTRLQPWLLKQ